MRTHQGFRPNLSCEFLSFHLGLLFYRLKENMLRKILLLSLHFKPSERHELMNFLHDGASFFQAFNGPIWKPIWPVLGSKQCPQR